jgi:hypothetical protein
MSQIRGRIPIYLQWALGMNRHETGLRFYRQRVAGNALDDAADRSDSRRPRLRKRGNNCA